MKRLLRVSLDILLTSIVPIVSWLVLGIVLDKNLVNIFSLTYPLQCLMGMIISIFGVGSNISIYKDKNESAADNGIVYGTIFSFILFGLIFGNSSNYIQFMNMDVEVYKIFGMYSIAQIFFQTILRLILTKLYYLEENKRANKFALLFNVINFISLISIAIITRNQVITAGLTAIIMFVIDFILFFQIVKTFDFKLNIINCFKYDSVAFSVSFLFFIIYLFGFSNSFAYGEQYLLAITFATLVTDMQWDVTDAVKTVAKIDIAKKKFIYKEHLRNANKLTGLIVLSVLFMSVILYPFYQPDLKIVSIFIFLHIVDFILSPFYHIKTCYLQLEDSALKMTVNMIISYVIRTIMSFLPTPFCTIIGQMCSAIYEWICTKINYRKYEIKE